MVDVPSLSPIDNGLAADPPRSESGRTMSGHEWPIMQVRERHDDFCQPQELTR